MTAPTRLALPADGQPVELTGTVDQVDQHTNRTRAPWATAHLTTDGQAVAVVVHPQLHPQVRHLLTAGARVHVAGRVDERDGQEPVVIAAVVERAA